MHWVKMNGKVLAACDKSLMGKTFKEGNKKLLINESFYKGELVEKTRLIEMLMSSDNINLVGEETVKVAEESNLISNIGKINKVPYAMIFKM